LLLDPEGAAEEVDVVIGAKQGDQSEEQAGNGLEEAEPIEAGPGRRNVC